MEITDVFRSLGNSYLTQPLYLGQSSEQTGQLFFFNSSSVLATGFQAGNATAAVTYTWPTAGPAANNYVLGSSTAGVLSWINLSSTGTPTFASLTLTATSNQLILGTTRTVTITAPTPATTSRTMTIPDVSNDASFVLTQGTQTISGTKTFDGQLIGKGTATNDSPSAGYIGEVQTSTVGTMTNYPTSGQYGDLTSISLTAGDWLVSMFIEYEPNGATVTDSQAGLGTAAGNSATGLATGDTLIQSGVISITEHRSLNPRRYSLSGTSTIYLKYFATYSVATPRAVGRITAVRIR